MAKNQNLFEFEEINKAGYNQAARITETLSMLRNSYVGCMIDEDYRAALKIARRVLDIISAKLETEEIDEVDKLIKGVKDKIPMCEHIYPNNRKTYFKYQKVRDETEIMIEKLWRKIEKLQDNHGYGMLAEEDYGL